MRSGSSIRWAFNCCSWEPTEKEWLLASQCVQVEDKQRIGKFAFKKDAKSSIIGRLMIRKFAHLATGLPYQDIIICRDKDNRPYIQDSSSALDFNVSHQGDYTVLAGEIGSYLSVGVDVMHFQRKTGHQLTEFFRLMRRQMSEKEWNTILAFPSVNKQSETFFRLWSLKESYVKAIGVGLHFDFQRISFTLNTPSLAQDKICDDTTQQVDEVLTTSWKFHESLLDAQHCVAVALHSPSGALIDLCPIPFTILNWSELMNEAKPFVPPDVQYCKEFFEKPDSSDKL